MTFDPIRFDPAAKRFKAFFEELNQTFAERENVLTQIALALLARQHVLLAGPPGTAKSQLASAVFGRILDEETGRPSLYSRQIGESTVRTDLVGPLNFKSLMETGRSEHFTDEGMLGAVHAFLDEVFDGRDMLLRDALNVLQERELKQGTTIVKGRIECALMTSNRYLVEVLESSRDTLLAFVDRVAFAGFVPRSFATEDALSAVLRRHVGHGGAATLVCPLTVQDLDTLQEACDEVKISDAMCDRLAMLLDRFDAELMEAVRADSSFIPTRYVSTRTAVGAGKLLRAIVILRRIVESPGRELKVTADDFRFLHLHLALCGPTPEHAQTLIARERDPRERRQLQIVLTERMLFDRVLAGLPAPAFDVAPPASTPSPSASTPPPREELRGPKRFARLVTGSNPKKVLEAMSGVVDALRSGELKPKEAQALLESGVATLSSFALVSALAPPATNSNAIEERIKRFAELADDIEHGEPTARHVARWLRGCAVSLIDESSRFATLPGGADLVASSARPGEPTAVDRARKRLTAVLDRDGLRRSLRARGADGAERTEAMWVSTLARAEEELLVVWDEALCEQLAANFAKGLGDVGRVVESLTPLLTELAEVERKLAPIGIASGFRARVVGPRLVRILDETFTRLVVTDRSDVFSTIVTLQGSLDAAGLRSSVAPERWVSWAVDILFQSERASVAPLDGPFDYDAYAALRRDEQRISNAFSLAEVALRSDDVSGRGSIEPAAAHARLVDALAKLSIERRTRVIESDIARMDRALTLLERWWERLQASRATTEVLVRERFIEVVWDQGALLRFALEAHALAELFPADSAAAKAISQRTEALQDSLSRHVDSHVRARADAAWARAFPEHPAS